MFALTHQNSPRHPNIHHIFFHPVDHYQFFFLLQNFNIFNPLLRPLLKAGMAACLTAKRTLHFYKYFNIRRDKFIPKKKKKDKSYDFFGGLEPKEFI